MLTSLCGILKLRRAAIGTLMGVMGLSAALVVSVNDRKGINRRSFDAIQLGATSGEVDSLIGQPAGWYMSPSHCPLGGRFRLDHREFAPEGVYNSIGGVDKGWAGDDGVIEIVFDESGRVRHKFFTIVFKHPGFKTGSEKAVDSVRFWTRRLTH
jgi:hypothetical protein